ncbi:phage head spike fiber domain-containing protein [Cupriavidus basilensis]|uniref:phage head spike fiber domain-containing protein n=1 Tax=Cupriavidus basilensis TaxID=68895 RepID=UPI00157A53D9|nr:hypothetical protein [Cupriavidus basilensis]NUA26095.1 hypothetical protein [Cupriavidus basilensis]
MLVSKNFGEIVTFTRASARWRYSNGGVLVQDAANVPSLDYDPITLAVRGLLIEDNRTNLFKYSQDFTNSAWNKQGFALTPNVAVAPDGTTTASLLVPTAAAGVSHNLEQNGITGAGAIGVTNVQSYFVKAAGYSRVAIWWPNTGAGDSFDLSTGTRIAGAGGTISPLGNGWFRIASPYAQPTTAGSSSRLYVLEPGTTGPAAWVGAADGVSGIYVWGGQIEVGAYPLSYTPTTAAQVTRAVDNAIITDLSKIAFNANEGTLYLEAVAPAGLRTDGGSQFCIGLDDNGFNNAISIGRSAARAFRAQIKSNNVDQGAMISGTWADNTNAKVALAYSASGASLCWNGGAPVSTPGAVSVPPLTRLRLGTNIIDGSAVWNSAIRNLRYIPRRLSSTELQNLTA